MSTENLERRLVNTLVVLAGREREYLHNAVFRAQMGFLCSLLPTMVNGIALEAEEQEKRMQRQIEAIRRAPFFTEPGKPVDRLLGDLGFPEV